MVHAEVSNSQDHLLQAVVDRDPRLAPAIDVGIYAFRAILSGASTLNADFLLEVEQDAAKAIVVFPDEAAGLVRTSEIHPQSLIDLEQALAGDGPRVIIMRHGTQFSDMPKIDMMRLPHNMTEPLTDISMAQAVATAVTLSVIAGKLEKPIRVISSENKRALQTAALIAGITGAQFVIDKRLNCVNYPPKKEVSDEELSQLLGPENKGALLWQKEIVDRVCGPGTFERISRDMPRLLARLLLQDNNSITIVITHTQQTQAADVLAEDEPVRLRELGVRLFSPSGSVLVPNGIFKH